MKKFLIRIKYFLKEKRALLFAKKENIIKKGNSKRVYIFLAADYGNLGDVAITYAQKEFIKKIFPKYEIIEVPTFKTDNLLWNLRKIINKDDIITIVGGGNLTNRYDSIEEARRRTIKNFKKNTIIIFPQTIEFTDDEKGKESLRRTKLVYKKHKKLIIFAREEKSYEYMKKTFITNKVYLVPDIVMSLKGNVVENNYANENSIGICFRDDKEKQLKRNIKDEIIQKYGKDNKIQILSTYIEYDKFNYETRYQCFFELLEKISKTKWFITDRLHGMIFCYITKTPCIAFDNDNHKISESYKKWLKNCSYIKLLEEKEFDNIDDIILQITNLSKQDVELSDYYKDLKQALKNADTIKN